MQIQPHYTTISPHRALSPGFKTSLLGKLLPHPSCVRQPVLLGAMGPIKGIHLPDELQHLKPIQDLLPDP
jgi:hypothetical protein